MVVVDRLFLIGGGGLVKIFLFLLKSETVGERSLLRIEVEDEEEEPLSLDSLRESIVLSSQSSSHTHMHRVPP